MSADLVEQIDEVRDEPRAQWIRRAVVELLRERGVEIPEGWIYPPDRTGKGGKPTHQPNTTKEEAATSSGTTEDLEGETMSVDLRKDPEIAGWTITKSGDVTPIYHDEQKGVG